MISTRFIIIAIAFTTMLVNSCDGNLVESDNKRQVDIPDARFKSILISAGYDQNNDGEISYSEAEKIISLDISESNPTSYLPRITEIKGLECFTNLEEFRCYNNKLSGEINLNKNTKLIQVDLGFNSISSINIKMLTNLRELIVNGNNLETLDLSTNIQLRKIDVSLNNLTNLDITKNIYLEELYFLGNSFTSIDLSKNIYLRNIAISGAHHNITALDISACFELEQLSLGYIDISNLDLSKNHKLRSISLQFLDKLEEICVWEIPLPDAVELSFQNCSAELIKCE